MTPLLELDDLRRLTGPNLLWEKPGSVIDVNISGYSCDTLVELWQQQVRELLNAVGWQRETTCVRIFDGGANLAISAPIDALYVCCDINEFAWQRSCLQAQLQELPAFEEIVKTLILAIAAERNPNLIALQNEAAKRQAPFLWDDDEVSIGHGKNVQIWPTIETPAANVVRWNLAQRVPCALITGTNGKSTSVRLAAKIAEVAGISAGVTSTDFIKVGDSIIDKGDYSGPGGARILLRNRNTELALLEVARGGILRRGLPIDTAQAALITNLAEDHLGSYGINTLAELTEVKFVVAKALGPDGILVLNADDESIVAHARKVQCMLCWFSLSGSNPVIEEHVIKGGRAVIQCAGHIIYVEEGEEQAIVAVDQIPMTMKGAAKHNIANALGVIGLSKALQFNNSAIAEGLSTFQSSAKDNPGRGNQFDYQGAKVFVDFAHNVHSMNAIVSTLCSFPAKRRTVLLGQPGDRSDADIQSLAEAAHQFGADHWVVAELPNYLRGREAGEVPNLIDQKLRSLGVAQFQIEHAPTVYEGAKKALSQAQKDDLILLLALDEREQVFELLCSEGKLD